MLANAYTYSCRGTLNTYALPLSLTYNSRHGVEMSFRIGSIQYIALAASSPILFAHSMLLLLLLVRLCINNQYWFDGVVYCSIHRIRICE